MTVNTGGAEQALIETQDKRIESLQAQVAALTTDLAMQIAALKDASKALTERQAKVAALEAGISEVLQTMWPSGERVALQLLLNPDMMHPPAALKQEEKT